MRIVNPTFGLSAAAGATVALKSVNWKTDAIALVSNSKPNARELLDGVSWLDEVVVYHAEDIATARGRLELHVEDLWYIVAGHRCGEPGA